MQRLASNSGGISVCRQKVALGRVHARKTITVLVSHDMLTIELDGMSSPVDRAGASLAT